MAHEIGRDSRLSDSNCQEEDEAPRDWAELCHQLKELRSSIASPAFSKTSERIVLGGSEAKRTE